MLFDTTRMLTFATVFPLGRQNGTTGDLSIYHCRVFSKADSNRTLSL